MTGHKEQFIKNVGSGWLAQGSAAPYILRGKGKEHGWRENLYHHSRVKRGNISSEYLHLGSVVNQNLDITDGAEVATLHGK